MTKSNWKKCKLGDICEDISYGYTASANSQHVGPKFLRITDIIPYFIDWDSVPYCDIEKDLISKYKLELGDIVIARTGATSGFNSLIDKEVDAVFASFLIRFRLNKEIAFPRFIKYTLKSDFYKEFIANNIGGSAQPGINAKTLSLFQVDLPPLDEQKRIAEVLGAFDDKIELLQKQNKTLEEMAKAIFKSWFVDFDIVKAKQKGEKKEDIIRNYHLTEELYNLFPSSFVDSSLGPIPTGWEVKSLTDFLEFEKGIEPGAKNYTTECVIGSSLPFYRVQDIVPYGNKSKTFVSIELLKGKVFSEEDILVSFDATLGRVFLGAKGGFSSGIRKIIVNNPDLSKIYILCFLKSDYFLQMLDKYAGAETTIKHAGKAINYLQIVYCQTVFKKFNKVLDNYFSKILNNIKQIQTLTELRDTLLPRLISGKIKV